MFIVSRCLIGINCKYDGGNNVKPDVVRFCEEHSCVSVCPEAQGGLKSPREPAEQVDGRVIDKTGKDVTEFFQRGAEEALRLAMDTAERKGEVIEGAILKAYSPSCGSGYIYDGTFTGRRVSGNGIFTKMLKDMGIPVATENNFKEVFARK